MKTRILYTHPIVVYPFITIGVTLVFVTMIEVGLRLGPFDQITKSFKLASEKLVPGLEDSLQMDEHLGWRPGPDHRRFYSNSGSERVSEEKTIVALGDSFTFGSEVSTRESWPAQLQQLTGRRVVNGGVGAYGVDQSILMSKALIEKLKPRTVVLSLLQETIERVGMRSFYGLAKPYFSLESGKLVFHPLAPHETKFALEAARQEYNQEFRQHLYASSILAYQLMKRFSPNTLKPSHKFTDSNSTEVTCHLVSDFRNKLKLKGIDFYVLVQEAFAWEPDNKFVDESLSCLKRNEVAVIDTRAYLNDLRRKSPSEYRSQFVSTHMSVKGNARVAEIIATALSKDHQTKLY